MSNDFGGKKRSELPDNVFGIPQERKYPMPDEKHTRSAIKLFNHVEPKYEEQLAKAIIKNMKKYNIDGSVVGPNNRLRKYLPKDMIKEYIEKINYGLMNGAQVFPLLETKNKRRYDLSLLQDIYEGYIKSDKDIYYNKDKFDSGEINLCFITGLSGSGKSTMARGMTSKNIEHYEMDDIICNDNFSDSNLKEYGGLIESFFKGPGKSFRLIRDNDTHNNSVFKSHKNYEKEITQAFVKHALSYCKSHMNTKFICDGIWVFMFINPSQLKDCAVYIKGTSSLKSGYRALKRDIDEDKRNNMTSLDMFKKEFRRIKEDVLYAKENQKELKSFRSYFEKQSTNESSYYSYTPQETGINTIIFDIGDVLVSSNLKDYLLNDPEIPDEIVDELISLWILDKDDIDESLDLDTYRDISVKRLGPDFSKYIPALFRNNVDCVNAFDYTIPLIKDLKKKGYKVYYLSNWSAWTHDLLQEAGKFDFISFMDGGIFSHEVGCRKPDPEIYDIFIKKYKINPETSIFFDDKEKNIKAAKNFGIRGVQFTYQDPSIVYNAINTLKSIKEYYEVNIPKYNTSIDNQYIISKEIIKIIKPVVLNDEKYKKQAKKINLTLKCELLPIKGSVISVLVLDGSQEYRDTDEARSLLNDIKKSCVDALNKYKKVIMNKFIKKVTTGDGDEGCIYFHISKLKTIVHGIKGDVLREYYNEYPKFPLVFNYNSDNTSIDLQKSIYEASISEYGTTGGTIVGTNQPDSVYIVNYMQNNAFSGHKEPKFGICKKGMKDLHVVGGKYNRFHYVYDLDKFKEEASDIHMYRYKGKPKNEFFDIIEEMDDNDLDLYKLITGILKKNVSSIQ